MELELISFDGCPFVQRSVITLLYKKAEFKVTSVDLRDKPDWFLKISPFGKVPCLRVTDSGKESVIFESAVINEFIDEVTPGRLHPEDPIERAMNRSWIEFGEACMHDFARTVMSEGREASEKARESLQGRFGRLENILGSGPFFNGEAFSLVDAAYAPMFIRIEIWRGIFDHYSREEFPKVAAWSDALLTLPEVRESTFSGLAEQTFARVRDMGTYASTLIADAA